jgi:predicted dehydrogenase
MHAEYSIRAAKAGKHVFCEKPMAITSDDCQKMIDACKDAGVKLGVGYRMQYEPHLLEMRKLIKAGAIGKIKSVTSAFGYNYHGDPNVWRLNKKLGGGPVYDVGIYCINSTRFALDEEPSEVTCTIDRGEGDPRFKDMEAGMDFTMKFPAGVEAHCKTAYNANSGNLLHIEGETGSLHLEPAFGYGGILLRTNINGEAKNFTPPQIPDQFATEIDSFCDSITNNKPVQTPGEEGLRDIKIIEALYKAGNEGKAVQI